MSNITKNRTEFEKIYVAHYARMKRFAQEYVIHGVQANKISATLKWTLSRNAYNHNFIDRVDPYIIKSDPKSGLLPYITEGPPGVDGEGDDKIQAYCFRMTLTDHPHNRIPCRTKGMWKHMFLILIR